MNRVGFIAGVVIALPGIFLLVYTLFGSGGVALTGAILATAIAALWMDNRGWFS